MRWRLVAFLLLANLAPVALANSAMGLGMEVWDLRVWFGYVAAMTLMEAWLIGSWLKLTWWRAVGWSILANAITGGCCGGSGCFAPFLHGTFAGTGANPNPFLNTVLILSYSALPSTFIESFVWRFAVKGKPIYSIMGRSLLIHLALVPVGFMILLLPERPYVGTERLAFIQRNMKFHYLVGALDGFVADKQRMPAATNPEELAKELKPFMPSLPWNMGDDLELAFYEPSFSRFSTRDERTKPFEFNRAAMGRPINDPLFKNAKAPVWILRSPPGSRSVRGIVYDPELGSFGRAGPSQLGHTYVEPSERAKRNGTR